MAEKYYGWSPYNYVMDSPLVFVDPDGRDIIIQSSHGNGDNRDEYQARMLKILDRLTDDELGIDKKTGKVYIVKRADDVSRPKGTGLVRGFIEGFETENGELVTKDVTITDNADGRLTDDERNPMDINQFPMTLATSPSNASNGKGTNSNIYILPDSDAEYYVSEDRKIHAPLFVALGHELIHAMHNAFGIRDVRIIEGHPAKNMEEYKTQQEDKEIFQENNLPGRYVKPLDDEK